MGVLSSGGEESYMIMSSPTGTPHFGLKESEGVDHCSLLHMHLNDHMSWCCLKTPLFIPRCSKPSAYKFVKITSCLKFKALKFFKIKL